MCTLCTMGKGEGDVKQLEALAVRAGEILEKQMPKAAPVARGRRPATTTTGAWLKAQGDAGEGRSTDGLLAMGVECVEDLHDVEPKDCIALGMSHIQQNRPRSAKLERRLIAKSARESGTGGSGKGRPTIESGSVVEVTARNEASKALDMAA